MIQSFDEPVYVTRPLLPAIGAYTRHLEDVWSSGILTNGGQKHIALERRLGVYLRNDNLSLFNNATAALMVALRALRVTGECVTTPFTFPATVHALNWQGVKPIFCDIDPVTLNLDTRKLEALVTPETTAILGVHTFGVPCAVHAIQEIADRYGLKVIYDGAHAFGTEIEGRGIASFGDATAFSFHATKLFQTGEGGALAVGDTVTKKRVDLLKNFGIQNENTVSHAGINGKMSEVNAALGLAVLDVVEEERKARAAILEIYRARLSQIDGVTLPPLLPGVRSSLQYLSVRIKPTHFGHTRDELHNALKAYNVHTRRYFYPLMSESPCYRQVPSADPVRLPVAHRVASEVLCLPFYGALGCDRVERICTMIEETRRKT